MTIAPIQSTQSSSCAWRQCLRIRTKSSKTLDYRINTAGILGCGLFRMGIASILEQREDFVSRGDADKNREVLPGASWHVRPDPLVGLKGGAPDVDLGDWWKHFRMEDYAQHKSDIRFKWWSSLRHQVAKNAWPFGPLLYLLSVALVCACTVRRQFREKLPEWPVIGLLAFVGASTFAVASLADDIRDIEAHHPVPSGARFVVSVSCGQVDVAFLYAPAAA